MSSSPYLAQAIQQMSDVGHDTGWVPPPGPSIAQMSDAVKQRKAWEAANPGQSYISHGLQQMAGNIAATPQNLMGAARNVAGLPGDVLSGLMKLGQQPGAMP